MQSRAARGLLNWTQVDLARQSGISAAAIRNFETGRATPTYATRKILRETFERAGVEFSEDGTGVRLNPGRRE